MCESTQKKRGEGPLWPREDVFSVNCPIFHRPQRTGILSSSPPCTFEIGKCRTKWCPSVLLLAGALGLSEAVPDWIASEFVPNVKWNFHFRLVMLAGCPQNTSLILWAHTLCSRDKNPQVFAIPRCPNHDHIASLTPEKHLLEFPPAFW